MFLGRQTLYLGRIREYQSEGCFLKCSFWISVFRFKSSIRNRLLPSCFSPLRSIDPARFSHLPSVFLGDRTNWGTSLLQMLETLPWKWRPTYPVFRCGIDFMVICETAVSSRSEKGQTDSEPYALWWPLHNSLALIMLGHSMLRCGPSKLPECHRFWLIVRDTSWIKSHTHLKIRRSHSLTASEEQYAHYYAEILRLRINGENAP